MVKRITFIEKIKKHRYLYKSVNQTELSLRHKRSIRQVLTIVYLRVKSHTLGITNKVKKKSGRILNAGHKKCLIQNGIRRRAQRRRRTVISHHHPSMKPRPTIRDLMTIILKYIKYILYWLHLKYDSIALILRVHITNVVYGG